MSGIRIVAAMLFATAAVVLPGCSHLFSRHSTAPRSDSLFAVTAETTPFYRFGPQQGQGPDRQLTRNTLVTVIRHSFGYSKVRLEDGHQGFVANEDLAPAPKRLLAQAASRSEQDLSDLPPTPHVKLPTSSPEFEPTPIPQPLMPQ